MDKVELIEEGQKAHQPRHADLEHAADAVQPNAFEQQAGHWIMARHFLLKESRALWIRCLDLFPSLTFIPTAARLKDA